MKVQREYKCLGSFSRLSIQFLRKEHELSSCTTFTLCGTVNSAFTSETCSFDLWMTFGWPVANTRLRVLHSCVFFVRKTCDWHYLQEKGFDIAEIGGHQLLYFSHQQNTSALGIPLHKLDFTFLGDYEKSVWTTLCR